MEFRWKRNSSPGQIFKDWLSFPFIYGMIVPLVFLDICLEIYHNIAFRLYGIELIKRRDYVKVDRHKLRYLHWWEKMNCAYCGYANGLLHYASTIAGRTEKHFCGIKHKKNTSFQEPQHHKDFLPYDSKEAFDEFVSK